MKVYNDKGFTLVELVVAFAILALIATGIIGIMSSNSVLFRKTKKDINISTSAQESYNKLTEDLMQAKYVYIEGGTCTSELVFPKTEPGSTSDTINKVQLLKTSDINILKDSSLNGGLDSFFTNLTSSPAAIKTAVNNDTSFNSYYNTFRYMSDEEKAEYKRFLASLPGGTYTSYTSNKLKTVNAMNVATYNNVYISKIVLLYAVPLDSKYVPDALEASAQEPDPANPGTNKFKDNDYCLETITFQDDKMYITNSYRYMTDMNTTTTLSDDNLFATDINYVVGSSANIPGVVAKIDGDNDSIMLDVYFAKYNMSYQNKGMTVIRNSYVLHDAK
ncbi:prepilin-type N-terminal cleavage/methylation domain-containing protein [Lachnospiraceae bacterium NE2001]|nr:prepilin-type N-terminal cleavage/methylation domain-containing protein [Lachnospiraceae bacterium NE2001]